MTPDTAEIVERAKASAREIRIEPGVPVRVIERDGKVIWSKVDDQMRDLTEENSDGLLYHVGSLFAPYGEANAIESLTAENERMREALEPLIAWAALVDADEDCDYLNGPGWGDFSRLVAAARQALSNTRGRG
jgi:hypothetical protein